VPRSKAELPLERTSALTTAAVTRLAPVTTGATGGLRLLCSRLRSRRDTIRTATAHGLLVRVSRLDTCGGARSKRPRAECAKVSRSDASHAHAFGCAINEAGSPKQIAQPCADTSSRTACEILRGLLGHNVPQEAPEAFAKAVVDVAGYGFPKDRLTILVGMSKQTEDGRKSFRICGARHRRKWVCDRSLGRRREQLAPPPSTLGRDVLPRNVSPLGMGASIEASLRPAAPGGASPKCGSRSLTERLRAALQQLEA